MGTKVCEDGPVLLTRIGAMPYVFEDLLRTSRNLVRSITSKHFKIFVGIRLGQASILYTLALSFF